jgi:hypothetical protein
MKPVRIQVNLQFDKETLRDEILVYAKTKQAQKEKDRVFAYLLDVVRKRNTEVRCEICRRSLLSWDYTDFVAVANKDIRLLCEECA